jgi:hypothetical protein
MFTRLLRLSMSALLAIAAFGCSAASAQVNVEIIGDTAHATILLADTQGNIYDAEVTIVFDSPLNLSAQSLGLSAELFDPADPAMTSRLPAGIAYTGAFPMVVTVEPPALDWIFASAFDGMEDGTGALSFRNDYQLEIHTHNLAYQPGGPLRLLKAPLNGAFADVTEDVLNGSARARGRGGAFSQFVIGVDANNAGLPLILAVIIPKTSALSLRLVSAVLGNLLRGQLVALLTNVLTAVTTAILDPLLGCTNALGPLDEFIASVRQSANAGEIANLWRAQHDVVNDAGELESLAQTLRFSLLRCTGAP